MNTFDTSKPIAIGSDHAGFDYKTALLPWLTEKGLAYKDFGTYSAESTDYPDFAHPVASAVENKEAAFGILLCGSGTGVAITANKHQAIRAALCWQKEIAELARQHNNCNIICLPARFTTLEEVKEMIDIFIKTPFQAGRHELRVNKIAC